MSPLLQTAQAIAADPKSSACATLSGMEPQKAAIKFAEDQRLISSARAVLLNQIVWNEDFSSFISPADELVTNAAQVSLVPPGAFISFIEVDQPATAAGRTGMPMGKRHLIHAMISLGGGYAAGSRSGKALGIGAGEGWEVVNLAKDLHWVPCTNGYDAINAVPLGVKKSRLLRIRYRPQAIDIPAFIKQHAGQESAIRSAIANNDAAGGQKRDKFDVVADLVFPADKPLDILAIDDWSSVKKNYVGTQSDVGMWLILAYRKRYVDRGIARQNKECAPGPGQSIIPKSVGSTDLTSDYDITVGIPGGNVSGAELDVIARFNTQVRTAFGQQPGTVFDTNLYAKDFLALNSNDSRLSLPGVGASMYAMVVEGQDIGALVKQRRYMSSADWHKYLGAVLKVVGQLNPAAVSVTHNRYESADGQYLLNMKELLDEMDARAAAPGRFGTAYADAKRQIDSNAGANHLSPAEMALVAGLANQDMADVQLRVGARVLQWEHDYADLVLWATNDLYVGRMRDIRKIQQAATTGNSSSSALDTRVADLISSAIFFAAEAYLSEGALRHVVDGQAAKAGTSLKGAELDKTISQALMDLSAEQLLQSVNEQFGDFLKDFAHYGDSPEFLYRGSKYLQRLFEALNVLSMKKQATAGLAQPVLKHLNLADIDAKFKLPTAKILERLNSKNEGLVAVRKGEKTFKPLSDRDAYCLNEVQTYFGASSGAELKDCMTGMVLLLNAQVRSDLATVPTLDEVRAYFRTLNS